MNLVLAMEKVLLELLCLSISCERTCGGMGEPECIQGNGLEELAVFLVGRIGRYGRFLTEFRGSVADSLTQTVTDQDDITMRSVEFRYGKYHYEWICFLLYYTIPTISSCTILLDTWTPALQTPPLGLGTPLTDAIP
jgi:hypothetical protein